MTSNWMGLYIFRLYLALSLLCYRKIPKNPFPLVKTASELSKVLEFPSLLPLRVCDNQSLPTSLANSNIPELWQIYRLHPRG